MSIQNQDLRIIGKLLSKKEISWSCEEGGLLAGYCLSGKGESVLEQTRLQSLEKADFVISTSGRMPLGHSFRMLELSYVNNRDGSIRWLFPAGGKKPAFLWLFNASNGKSKLLKRLSQLAFLMGLGGWIRHGSIKLYHKEELLLGELVKQYQARDFAIFTGTEGPNRKVVVATGTEAGRLSFIKWPLDAVSQRLIQNEIEQIHNLKEVAMTKINIPKAQRVDLGTAEAIALSNVKPNNPHQSTELIGMHVAALSELYSITHKKRSIVETDWYGQLFGQIQNSHFNANIQSLLFKAFSHLDASQEIPVAVAHGDFTPWNMYLGDERLSLYDWELAMKEAPILFDLFHFIFQTEILVRRSDYASIRAKIERAVQMPEVRSWIEKCGIDVCLHYRLYLLINVSYYAELYSKQERLHPQAFWLSEIWEEALQEEVAKQEAKDCRERLIGDLFGYLEEKPYVWLKSRGESPLQLGEESDLDLLVAPELIAGLGAWLHAHPSVSAVKSVQSLHQHNISVFLKNGAFLSIDLITRFERKGLKLLSAPSVLEQRIQNAHKVFVPSDCHEFEAIWLFYLLNGSKVPSKYMAYFTAWEEERQVEVLGHINEKYGLRAQSLSMLRCLAPSQLKQLENGLRTDLGCRIKGYVHYLVGTLKKVYKYRGIVLTVSGVDGAGKSTLISELQHRITKQYRREVVVLRHRPSLLPILSAWRHGKAKAEQLSMSRLPRQGKNSSEVGSMLRFGYYFADYLFGQIYVFLKYVLMGKVVIYDRYYFDFINDARRSNIRMNSEVAKMLYAFIYKPCLNFFVYASPKVILERKKELDATAIRNLNSRYLALFEDFGSMYSPSQYVAIENVDKEKTIREMLKSFVSQLQK